MSGKIITGRDLKRRGWPQGKIIGYAKNAAQGLSAQGLKRDEVLTRLDATRAAPAEYLNDATLGLLAQECLRRESDAAPADPTDAPYESTPLSTGELRSTPLDYAVWGAQGIDAGAIEQMNNALRLPVSVAGALMPDAHVGYGLPIGGVLATHEAVIPYAVGVDIACRMRLSVYDVSPHVLGQQKSHLEKAILQNTKFGAGKAWSGKDRHQHEVLDDPAWRATPLLKTLQFKAQEQLGTSGTGNHFVEWGEFELKSDAPEMNLKAGKYLALLSHSGSRAVGFKIANEYSRLAMNLHPKLDKAVRHLAWLPMDREAGQEYWLSMELAGRFASANHFVIHQRVAAAAGFKEIAHVENHHNFCVPGDAVVPTTNGPKPMQDIKEGDEVYACDLQGGLTPTPVTRHWQSGFKPVRAIATRSRLLRVSDDHPVLAIEVEVLPRGEAKSGEAKSGEAKSRQRKRGRLCWKRAAEIQARDIIVCAESYYEQDEAVGSDRARWAGAFLGDGWVRHDTTNGRYTVGLAIGGRGESHTQRYLDLLQGVLPPARWSVCAPGAYGLTCASARVWREIETLELRARSKQKRVPSWAFRLPLLEKLALLAGYVDADGSVADARSSNHGRATLASTNRELLCDLRELAISCGLQITPIISALTRSNFGATVAHRCVLTADSANRLELWHQRKTRNKRATRYQKPRGLQASAIGYLELPPGCFAQRVLSVSHSQVAQPVYDLTVEHSSHSFVVEGVIVHNCWKEVLANGEEVYVHRKGATPAGMGVLGVIPGSMGDPGYVVKGKGLPASINSASHGAGRKLGRKAAIAAITKKMRDEYLKARGVTLLGGGLDESPQAYKDIEVVIAAQDDLVEVLGKFTPKIVKMASEAGDV